jgi:acyl-CoA thioester hydrolase
LTKASRWSSPRHRCGFWAGFDDELDLAVRITRVGETSLGTSLEVEKDGTLIVEGTMRSVFIDPEAKSKRPIPQDVRAAVEPFLVADG